MQRTTPAEKPLSYQQPSCGPWGISLEEELASTARANAAFSQWAWESAKQDGCLPCPRRNLPQWPPTGKFLYPTMQKEPEEVIGAREYDPSLDKNPDAAPWQNAAPPQLQMTSAMARAEAFLKDENHRDFLWRDTPHDSVAGGDVEKSALDAAAILHGPGRGTNGSGRDTNGSGRDTDGGSGRDTDEEDTEYTLANLFPCIGNTWTGIAYDLAHYDQLPGAADGTNVLTYVLARDDRWKYALTTGLLILSVVLLIAAVIVSCTKSR